MSVVPQRKPKTPNLKRCYAIRRRLEQGQFDLGETTWVDTTGMAMSETCYNLADLFSGAGGLALGFSQAGYWPALGIEVDPAASTTFRHNFPEAVHWEGHIQDASIQTIRSLLGDRKLHVLVAGFPCPGFSVAGHRNTEDRRNYLYKEVCRFAHEFQPWFVVLENVPGFVTLGRGEYMTALRNDLVEAGYTVSVQVLESASYGVPQLRPRTIIVGNRFSLPNPYPRPILTKESEYVPIEAAIGSLKTIPPCPQINHEWTKHSEEMIIRLSRVPPGGSLYSSYVDAWKRQYPGLPAMTIKENHGGTHIHPELDRVLSAREIARVQSFPDSFIFWGTMKRVMFQVGNAVPPLLAKHVALALRPTLDNIVEVGWGEGR